MTYAQLLSELQSLSDESFLAGQQRITNDKNLRFLGVRTPDLRKIAKQNKDNAQLFDYPDEYYEVVFIKLAVASFFDYGKLVLRLDSLVALITDWALCDSAFKPLCIKKHKAEFVSYITKYIAAGGEFQQRFAYIMLLSFYVEEEWLNLIKDCIAKCDCNKYYSYMAAAWLIADVLTKHYSFGLQILNGSTCDIKVKNKAISKACDSFRITEEKKNELRNLRKKINGK